MTETPFRFTLWIETEDDAPTSVAEVVARHTLTQILAATRATCVGRIVTVRSTLDMPGTWLADVEIG